MVEKITEYSERFVLVYLLPRQVQLQIEDTFLHWKGITRPAMGFHVSVLGPFVVVPGRTQDDLAIIGDLCRNEPAFDVVLGDAGIFHNATNEVVYLALVNPEPMRTLHCNLLEGTRDIVAAPSPEYHLWTVEEYIPHITLGTHFTEDDLSEFESFARSHLLRLNCHVQELLLLKQIDGVWQNLASFPLQERPTTNSTLGHS